MNNTIDTEKIRELLEKEIRCTTDNAPLKEILSLLPPPCSKCGGSGEKFLGITGRTDPVYETCPTCKGSGLKPSPCGNYDLDDPRDDCWGKGKVEAEEAKAKPCQAPAGIIEEFVKALKKDAAYDRKIGLVEISITLFNQACTHLEAQAKQNKQLARDYNCVESLCNSMDEFGEPMKDQQWTGLGERIYEIVTELKTKIIELETEQKECRQVLEKQLDRDKDPNDSLRDLVVVACNGLYWARAKKKHFVMANLQAKIEQLEEQLREGHHCASFEMCEDAGEKYEKQIEQLEAENRWIPVSERLPELKSVGKEGGLMSDWVHITDGEKVIDAHYYDFTKREAKPNYETGKGWYCHGMSKEKITHWKPIILPLQKEKE